MPSEKSENRFERSKIPRVEPLFLLAASVRAERAEDLGALLVAFGAGAVEERSTPEGAELRVYGESRAALAAFAVELRRELVRPERARVVRAPRAASNWQTEWTHHLEPVELTPDIEVVPVHARSRDRAPRRTIANRSERRTIRLEVGMAFGYGEHPTTRLSARGVERRCRRGAISVLDVGTGSGVLSIVAALSGARRVLGIDVDSAAIRLARKNAESNGVLRRCRFETTPLEQVRSRFDLVVANLPVPALRDLGPGLSRAVKPGGALLLAGMLDEDRREIVTLYRGFGLASRRRKAEDAHEAGWALLEFRRG